MSDSKTPDENSPAPKIPSRALLWVLVIMSALILALALLPPLHGDGSWVCKGRDGTLIGVTNPANCGPDDLILWCEVWNAETGQCVG